MHAQQLYLMVDGVPQGTNYWGCGKCRRLVPDHISEAGSGKEYAEACCRPTVCEKHGEYQSYCDQCWKEKQAADMAWKEFSAKVEPDYSGWVWTPHTSRHGGFFESVAELVEYFDGMDLSRPAVAFCCTEQPFALDLAGIIEDEAEQDGYCDDVVDMLRGEAELAKAIEVFNEANKKTISYNADHSRKVMIPQEPEDAA